jgi:hypothetical protein
MIFFLLFLIFILFVFALFTVPNSTRVSGLSICDFLSVFSNVYFRTLLVSIDFSITYHCGMHDNELYFYLDPANIKQCLTEATGSDYNGHKNTTKSGTRVTELDYEQHRECHRRNCLPFVSSWVQSRVYFSFYFFLLFLIFILFVFALFTVMISSIDTSRVRK